MVRPTSRPAVATPRKACFSFPPPPLPRHSSTLVPLCLLSPFPPSFVGPSSAPPSPCPSRRASPASRAASEAAGTIHWGGCHAGGGLEPDRPAAEPITATAAVATGTAAAKATVVGTSAHRRPGRPRLVVSAGAPPMPPTPVPSPPQLAACFGSVPPSVPVLRRRPVRPRNVPMPAACRLEPPSGRWSRLPRRAQSLPSIPLHSCRSGRPLWAGGCRYRRGRR